jgi:hypothetical protein
VVSLRALGGRRASCPLTNNPRHLLHAIAAHRYRCAQRPFRQVGIYKHDATYFAAASPEGPPPTIQTFLTENFPIIASDTLRLNIHSAYVWYGHKYLYLLAPAIDPQSHHVMDKWRQHRLTQCSAYLSARLMAGLNRLTLAVSVIGACIHLHQHACTTSCSTVCTRVRSR